MSFKSDDQRKAVMAKLVAKEIDNDYNKIIKRTAKAKGCFLKPNGDFERIKRQKTNGETITIEKVEAFCGASTDVLEKFIHKKYGKNFGKAEVGVYLGEDGKNSESYNPIEKQLLHEWFRLPDGTIIDGSAGQFKQDQKGLGKDDRLRIIPPDDPKQKDYVEESFCNTCGSRLDPRRKICQTCKDIKQFKRTGKRPDPLNQLKTLQQIARMKSES